MEIIVIFLIIKIVILLFSVGILIFITTHLFFWLMTGVPFLSSDKKLLEIIEKEIDWKKVKKFYDLGSGNGDVLKFFASRHKDIDFVGYELDFLRILKSKIFCFLPNVKFIRKNFFKVDISDADVVFVFLLSETLKKIIKKLQRELRSGTIIISNSFLFPDDFPVKKKIGKGDDLKTIYFYEI